MVAQREMKYRVEYEKSNRLSREIKMKLCEKMYHVFTRFVIFETSDRRNSIQQNNK